MQLVAYGAQDIYLTGNPQITFFKVVYRRHTNFSMESIQQTLEGNPGPGNQMTATISRNGDLVHKMNMTYIPQGNVAANAQGLATAGTGVAGSSLVNAAGGVNTTVGANIGHTLFQEIELEIGGQRIDKHYSHWLTIWSELTESNPYNLVSAVTANANALFSGSVGGRYLFDNVAPQAATTYTDRSASAHGGTLTNVAQTTLTGGKSCQMSSRYAHMSFNHTGTVAGAGNVNFANAPQFASVPLQFWFCRHPGLALPLIALQYHEVKLKINLCNNNGLSSSAAAPLNFASLDIQLWCDYIYLDTDERRRFAQQSHEYLIEQLQVSENQGIAANSVTLNFNHPVKELIWTGAPINTAAGQNSQSSGTPSGAYNATGANTRVTLKLNGHERFTGRHPEYFSRTQVYQHHSGSGGVSFDDSINVYSFALKPEEHQPSGTCNFSRIDNATLEVRNGGTFNNVAAGGINVYAVNYNVLRIMSGMGGLAYSN